MSEPSAERPYCSQPTPFGGGLLFVSAGDLWALESGQSLARRLTATAGSVVRPIVSPCGRWIAFAAREDAPTGVYLMPAGGGEARRLVHHSTPAEPVAFSPDGQRVLFVSTLGSANPRTSEIFSVSLDGADIRREPFGPAATVALHADGRIVLGRGYQDPARWKRYRGGLIGRLWAGMAEPLDLRCITTGRVGEAQPGFWGDRIVFLSDEDGVANVWSCLMDGSDRRQHTRHADHYARSPQVRDGLVAYSCGGDIWTLDLATNEATRVDVSIAADIASMRRRYVDGSRFMELADLSADGRQVLATTRGKVFAFPAWRGPVRALGDVDGVRFSHATWMKDGKAVVLAHDASGEEEVEIRALDGSVLKNLGRVGEGRLRLLAPSPDGRFVALSEQATGLQLVEVETGERRVVDHTDSGAITEVSWSPDSKWLAYARPKGYRSRIFLYEVDGARSHALTSPEFDDVEPCFDPAGRFLYFLSRRVYNPYMDELQHDVAFPATTKPFALVLASNRVSPFAALPTEDLDLDAKPPVPAGAEVPAAGAEMPTPTPVTPAPVQPTRVDLDGLSDRVVEIPVAEGRYSQVAATRDMLFFVRLPLLGMAASADGEAPRARIGKLIAFELSTREEKTWATDVRSVTLSADGKQILVAGEAELRVLSASKAPSPASAPGGKAGEQTGSVDLARLRVRIDPPLEWMQIFRDAWRQQRGHFWTALSEGGWEESRRRYEPLARRVATRDELSDVLWDMQGDLGTSHAYVVGGDEPWRPHYRTGLLGADLEFDAATGRHRIAKVHRGDSWSTGGHSPLIAPGVDVRAGDILLAVDGRECGVSAHPWSLLERVSGSVRLTVARSPDLSDVRDVVIVPLASEYRCRYREWVRNNQAIVDAKGGGRIGYVHVPDMQVAGLVEFHRAFLWQSGREGLIVDVRDNGGGNVSQILLERLTRRLIGYVKARWAEPETLPQDMVVGPMVALCNERTGSDGDIFCQSWKQLGLGTLIGMRTWGGVIGIDRGRTLVDGGYTTQPEYAFWFKERGWDVEGSGVEPDIELDITPADHAAGWDPQLDLAITQLMSKLPPEGRPRLELPPPPNRTR